MFGSPAYCFPLSWILLGLQPITGSQCGVLLCLQHFHFFPLWNLVCFSAGFSPHGWIRLCWSTMLGVAVCSAFAFFPCGISLMVGFGCAGPICRVLLWVQRLPFVEFVSQLCFSPTLLDRLGQQQCHFIRLSYVGGSVSMLLPGLL